jgi:hypothetical protein
MENEALLAFGVVLGLLVATAIARHLVAPSWKRDALSIALVTLGLIAAFMFFFAAGSFMRKVRPQPALHGQAAGTHGLSADRIDAVG